MQNLFTSADTFSWDLAQDGSAVAIAWSDRASATLDAKTLWLNCPSAAAKRRRMDGTAQITDPKLHIVRATPIGRYGINIAFSDGHDRGIYPSPYLRALAARSSRNDFLFDEPERRPDAAASTNPFLEHEGG